MHLAGECATPPRIVTEHQFAQLAQLSLAPFEVDTQRHQAQFGGSPQTCFKLNDTSVAKIEVYICAGRLTAQSYAPIAGLLLPKRQVGIEKREWKLLEPLLDVYAGVGGLEVWQGRRLALPC